MDFIQALEIAQGVFDQYKADQYKWWRKMDGTPILNDVAVRMAEAFRDAAAPAPVSGIPDLASLQRFVCDLRNSYGMRDDDQGAWVLLADVERLLNPAGEKK